MLSRVQYVGNVVKMNLSTFLCKKLCLVCGICSAGRCEVCILSQEVKRQLGAARERASKLASEELEAWNRVEVRSPMQMTTWMLWLCSSPVQADLWSCMQSAKSNALRVNEIMRRRVIEAEVIC